MLFFFLLGNIMCKIVFTPYPSNSKTLLMTIILCPLTSKQKLFDNKNMYVTTLPLLFITRASIHRMLNYGNAQQFTTLYIMDHTKITSVVYIPICWLFFCMAALASS